MIIISDLAQPCRFSECCVAFDTNSCKCIPIYAVLSKFIFILCQVIFIPSFFNAARTLADQKGGLIYSSINGLQVKWENLLDLIIK